VTDSANNPLAQGADQAPAGLDDLLACVVSGEDEQPQKKKICLSIFIPILHNFYPNNPERP
tara:strand:+ start:1071 stop:1253 length:183 start_codon:yes stop_codon:yes gene_type:complete